MFFYGELYQAISLIAATNEPLQTSKENQAPQYADAAYEQCPEPVVCCFKVRSCAAQKRIHSRTILMKIGIYRCPLLSRHIMDQARVGHRENTGRPSVPIV